MAKKFVSVIIVNWNGKKHLDYCLPSLAKIDYPGWEVVIVDNGSTDGSVEMIKKIKRSGKIKNIKIIENQSNLGFAQGNNIGFKNAKGDYILLLNNDTKVSPDLLTKLVRAAESDKKVGVVQPKIIFMDSGRLQAGGSFLTNTGFLYHFGCQKNPENEKYLQPLKVFSASGSCVLAKREMIEKVGLFDPDFFCYFEETDFCWRVWLAGYQVLYLPTVTIYHKGSQTARRLRLSLIEFHAFKNRLCSLIINLSLFELLKILPVHLLFCQVSAVGFLVAGKFSGANAWAIQRAIGWNILHLKETLKKRRRVQGEIRKISDRELMTMIKRQVRLSYYYYLFMGLEKYED